MDILVRKIQRNGDSLIFKPNSKSGFKFTEDYALPELTPFQKSCIQIKAQKDRKLGSFWTPNFCYIGMLLVEHGEVSLSNVLKDDGVASTEVFNNHFPEKKWYWYNKADEQNLAVQTYFMGVRAVGSLIAYYYGLQKTSRLREADVLYRQYLKPLGVAKILSQVDSKLVCGDDNVYIMELTNTDCLIISDDVKRELQPRKPNKSEARKNKALAEPSSQDDLADEKGVDSGYGNQKAEQDIKPNDDYVFDKKPTKFDIPKINSVLEAESDKETITTKDRSKKPPHRLPKIGEL